MNTPTIDNKLIAITSESFDVLLSLPYATINNFTGQVLYPTSACYLHEDAASRLPIAIDLLKPLQLRLKIWDGFRPLSVQKTLFKHHPFSDYISSPETGVCPHCRGVAIDLTIIDRFNNELNMGTDFDDFSSMANHGNNQISTDAQKNRLLLAGIMSIAGFQPFNVEWWHYQLPNAINYPYIEYDDLPTSFK